MPSSAVSTRVPSVPQTRSGASVVMRPSWLMPLPWRTRRVLRLMREHGLLSPRRVRQGNGISHEGRVTTDAPGVMWGTDGTRVLTAEEGMCWVFTAVDHYSCEVVGRHVCKRGDRFAALQPVAQGLARHRGSPRKNSFVSRYPRPVQHCRRYNGCGVFRTGSTSGGGHVHG